MIELGNVGRSVHQDRISIHLLCLMVLWSLQSQNNSSNRSRYSSCWCRSVSWWRLSISLISTSDWFSWRSAVNDLCDTSSLHKHSNTATCYTYQYKLPPTGYTWNMASCHPKDHI